MKVKESTWAYIAGIVDGEGSILLTRTGSKWRTPVLSVANTSLEMLNFLQQIMGGYIVSKKKYKKHHKQSYAWHVNYDRALFAISKIEKYLTIVEKQERARFLILGYKKATQRNGKYSPDQEKRKLLFEEEFFKIGDGR